MGKRGGGAPRPGGGAPGLLEPLPPTGRGGEGMEDEWEGGTLGGY